MVSDAPTILKAGGAEGVGAALKLGVVVVPPAEPPSELATAFDFPTADEMDEIIPAACIA